MRFPDLDNLSAHTLQNRQPTNAMPDLEQADHKYSVTKNPPSVSDDDPGLAPPGEASGRLSVSEGGVNIHKLHGPGARRLSRADLLEYIKQLESNAKEFMDKNRDILENLKAQVSLAETSSSSGVNALHNTPETSSGAVAGPNVPVLPESFAPSVSIHRSDSSCTVTSAPIKTTGHSHLDVTKSDGENNSKDANVSPLKPDPIYDNADHEVEPDAGDFDNQDDVDYEEYLLLGEELREFGWYRPSLLAAKQELTVRAQIMPWMDNTIWLSAADEVLASIEEPVLQAIMTREGNLNRLVATDSNMAQAIRQNEERCLAHQPSVYVSALTHDASEDFASFTVAEAREIARYAWSYALIRSNQKIAFQIDHAHNPSWQESWTQQGSRFFLHTAKLPTGDYTAIHPPRQKVLTTFACALDKIAAQAERARKSTIPVMQHVGYSASALHREQLHQHSPRSTAPWLAQFVLAAAKALGYSTRLAAHTVYVVPEQPCGPVAQVLLSRMARAYYFTGGLGSGVVACAASVAHMRSKVVSEGQEEEWWAEAERYMKSDIGYRRRFEEEMRRRDELFEEEEEEAR